MDPLTVEAFERVKRLILRKGDRRTYCAMYNRNPHLAFVADEGSTFDAYLHPDVGQRNIHCDPELSDFDELVVQDWNDPEVYASVRSTDGALAYAPERRDALRRYFERMLRDA